MDSQSTALAERVRVLVRERRIDPRADADSVRRAALDAVAEHEARSLTGAVRSLDEPDLVVGQIVADVAGFGALQAYLDDDTIEEIWINEPSRVFVARNGRHELTPVILTAEQVRELVERMLSSSGRRLDISQPFVDAMLPGGHRLHVVLDGISRGFAAVNIRKSKPCSGMRVGFSGFLDWHTIVAKSKRPKGRTRFVRVAMGQVERRRSGPCAPSFLHRTL